MTLLVTVLVYGISSHLHATYQSSATFRVVVPNVTGINDGVVTAANDLASQYAQLATAAPVTLAAASKLGVSPRSLNGRVSAGTANATNVVQVVVTGSSAGAASAGATAVMNSLVAYIAQVDGAGATTYTANVQRYLTPVNDAIGTVGARMLHDSRPVERSVDATLLASLVSQREQTLASQAKDAAAGQPTLQPVSPGGAATRVSPRPGLYAAIALVVALLICARIVYLASSREPVPVA